MSNKKILVAEDDPGIIDVMKIVLENGGFNVTTAMNGNNILKLCEQKPDLIFLDVWMSGINGNEICKQLKAHKEFKRIPVIIFSANKDTKQIAEECGADAFLAKPFDISELLHLAHLFTNSIN